MSTSRPLKEGMEKRGGVNKKPSKPKRTVKPRPQKAKK